MKLFINYILAPLILLPYLKLFNHLEVFGSENIPSYGPAIIIANHLSMWDPVILYCVVKARVCFMAKEELFKVPVVGYVVKKAGSFPVKRDSVDRNSLRQAARVLEEGKILGIFPEGHRSPDGQMQKFRNGAALFAHRSSATVIPVLFENTRMIFPKSFKSRIKVVFGRPIDLSNYYSKKANQDVLDEMTESFKSAISGLCAVDTVSGK